MWYITLTSVQICALSRQRKIRKVSLNEFWAYPQSLALCLFNGCMRIFQFFPILKVFHFVNPHKPVFCMGKENSHYFKIWLQVLIIEIEIKSQSPNSESPLYCVKKCIKSYIYQ